MRNRWRCSAKRCFPALTPPLGFDTPPRVTGPLSGPWQEFPRTLALQRTLCEALLAVVRNRRRSYRGSGFRARCWSDQTRTS